MRFVSCGRTVDVQWDEALQMWEVQIDGIDAIGHCAHWGSIDAHVATVIESVEES